MTVRKWFFAAGLACWAVWSLTPAQWVRQGQQEELYEKAILDVGTVSLQSFAAEDFPGDEAGKVGNEGETLEWLRFQGHATYCFPSGDFPVGREPVSALILMDPDRKAYLATLKPSSGGIQVSVARIYIVPCP